MSTIPAGQQKDDLKLPAAGKLTVDLSSFQGDGDLCLYSGGSLIGSSTNFVDVTKETVAFKV